MKIGLDIDGVIRDWAGKLKHEIIKHFPDVSFYPENFSNYDIFTWTNIPKHTLKEFVFYENAQEIFENACNLDSYVYNFIPNLQKMDHEVYFISQQPTYEIQIHTINWLDKMGLGADGLFFIYGNDKNFADVLIDDCTENLSNFSGFPICCNQPWNQDFEGCRVNNLKEALQIIEGMKNDN